MTEFTAALVRDPDLSRVTVSGPDATAFLDAQSMTALAVLEAQCVRRCGFADSKGRVIATATIWHTGTHWRLILPTEEADWLVAHLLRVRFRARVEIGVRTEWTVVALFGNDVPAVLRASHLSVPAVGMATATDDPDIALMADGRCLIAGEAERMPALLDTLSAECAGAERTQWYGVCMRAGEVAIHESTRGQVPRLRYAGGDRLEQGLLSRTGNHCPPAVSRHGQAPPGVACYRTGRSDRCSRRCGRCTGRHCGPRHPGENGRPVTQVVAPCPPDARLNSVRL